MTRYLEIKPGSISETIKRLSDDYQAVFKAELEKAGKGLAQMTDAEKKAFFNKIDKMHNAKSEMAQTMPAKKLDDTNSTMVVKPGAPAGQEKVIRIPKEKLADYKSKGYVEAESYIPEAKKIDELTAGQKKLPPALQKAIKAKEKSEAVDNPYAIGMAAAMKATGDKPPLKKSTITKAHDIADKVKKEEVELDENISQVTTKKSGTDTDIFYKGKHIGYFHKITSQHGEGKIGNYFVYHDNEDDPEDFTQSDEASSESQAKKIAYDSAKFNGLIEEVDLNEGGFKDIDIRKGDLKLARDKRQQLKDKYNAIMANQATGDEDSIADQIQKLDMSIKKQEQDLIDIMKKGKEDQKNEAVDPERVTNLNQKIAKMTTKMGELDMSKPESKTKEAILKSDITTAKLRLQDLMQKSAGDMKKAVNEMKKAKQSYKSLKMSMKKEQDTDNRKKTLTDKPLTKIEVNPKIEG